METRTDVTRPFNLKGKNQTNTETVFETQVETDGKEARLCYSNVKWTFTNFKKEGSTTLPLLV